MYQSLFFDKVAGPATLLKKRLGHKRILKNIGERPLLNITISVKSGKSGVGGWCKEEKFYMFDTFQVSKCYLELNAKKARKASPYEP